MAMSANAGGLTDSRHRDADTMESQRGLFACLSRGVIRTPAPDSSAHAETAAEQHVDGRRLRAERNRDSVVAAVLSIIQEQGGGPFPGASEVAARASVSERTVFRHFADLDSLFLAAASHQRPTLTTYLAPRPDAPELEKRIAAVVKLRSRLYEEIAPVRRMAVRLAARHATLADQMSEAYKAARAQVATVFSPELRRAGRAKATVLDELDLVLSWSTWETLRTIQGASPDRARKLVTAMLTAVLAPYEAPKGRRR
jgi:AcrR family transcriptional regulator